MSSLTPSRTRIRIVGQSGAGLLSVGIIVVRALRDLGFSVVADREYPSLIKGGHSSFMINFAKDEIHSLSEGTDILISMDKPSLKAYHHTLREGGQFIHGYERLGGIQEILKAFKKNKNDIIYLPIREVANEVGGIDLMKNVVLIGMLWKTLGLPFDTIKSAVEKKFGKRPKWLPTNLDCVEAGYERVSSKLEIELPKTVAPKMIIDGNHAIALGGIAGGVQVYFAYPMSPSSSILTHMANMAEEANIIVKQAEDEITVANLTLGAMHMGTRSMCATSGGGFDLMTETVSLSGMIETPWLCAVVQRPGPATGLPTWTGQGDLKLAIYSGHGEYAKIVIAVSDPQTSFELTQHALNLAEEYQVPVILLSDKLIAETLRTITPFNSGSIPIKRGLTDIDKIKSNHDRYQITKSGISKRWLPGKSEEFYYFANGDEHDAEGRIDETEAAGDMYAKRCKKSEAILASLPAPQIYGDPKAKIALVGWGSTLGVMQDTIQEAKALGRDIKYLHYEYLWPVDATSFEAFAKGTKELHLVEGNHDGQLGNLLEMKSKTKFTHRHLKWNGREFHYEEILKEI